MIRLSCVHQIFRAFMIRFSCVHQTNRAFMIRLSCVHKTIRAFMIRLSCVHQTIRAFVIRLSYVHQTFRAFMTRLSCVHQTFVRSCADFRAFIRPFVRSCADFCPFLLVSRPCKFERTTPPSCVHLGLDKSTFRLGPHLGKFSWSPGKVSSSTSHCPLVALSTECRGQLIKLEPKCRITYKLKTKFFLICQAWSFHSFLIMVQDGFFVSRTPD